MLKIMIILLLNTMVLLSTLPTIQAPLINNPNVPIVIPEEILTTTPTLSTTYYANTSSVSGGSYTDSSNINRSWWYDGDSLNFTEGAGANPLDVYFNFTGVDTFNELIIREYYLGSASHTIEVGILDWETGTYESYYSFVGQSGFNIITVPVYDPDEHLNLTNVSVRLHHVQNGIGTHRLYVDLVWLLQGDNIGASTNLAGYARYNFSYNNFYGLGNFTGGTIQGTNICYTNGTGCPAGIDYTNVAMKNQTNLFTKNQNISANLTITEDLNVTKTGSFNRTRLQSGLETIPSYSFVSDTNTGFYSVSADKLGVSCQGTRAFTFDYSGSVATLEIGKSGLPRGKLLFPAGNGYIGEEADYTDLYAGDSKYFNLGSELYLYGNPLMTDTFDINVYTAIAFSSGLATSFSTIFTNATTTSRQSFPSVINNINDIKVYSYKYKNETSVRFGFLSDDFETNFNYILFNDKYENGTGYRRDGIDAIQMKAIQELKQENDRIKLCLKNARDFTEYKLCVGGL